MIILFTTGCPRCLTLEKLLMDNNISYSIETDVDKMLSLGLTDVPVLEVDGKRFDYKEALNWVKQRG